jgi:transketolase
LASSSINLHTKPLDRQAVIQAANQSGVIVTAEDHQLIGGLNSVISQLVTAELGKSINQPTVIESVTVADVFGESGPAEDVLLKYNLTAKAIVTAVEKAIERKSHL